MVLPSELNCYYAPWALFVTSNGDWATQATTYGISLSPPTIVDRCVTRREQDEEYGNLSGRICNRMDGPKLRRFVSQAGRACYFVGVRTHGPSSTLGRR